MSRNVRFRNDCVHYWHHCFQVVCVFFAALKLITALFILIAINSLTRYFYSHSKTKICKFCGGGYACCAQFFFCFSFGFVPCVTALRICNLNYSVKGNFVHGTKFVRSNFPLKQNSYCTCGIGTTVVSSNGKRFTPTPGRYPSFCCSRTEPGAQFFEKSTIPYSWPTTKRGPDPNRLASAGKKGVMT